MQLLGPEIDYSKEINGKTFNRRELQEGVYDFFNTTIMDNLTTAMKSY